MPARTCALATLLILFALFLWQMMGRQRNATTELTYTEFTRQLDAGNVATVEVFDGRLIKGEFRTAVARDNVSAKNFTLLLPFANTEKLEERLDNAGVSVTGREAKSGFVHLPAGRAALAASSSVSGSSSSGSSRPAATARSASASPRRSCSPATRRRSRSRTSPAATRPRSSSRKSSSS